MTFAIASTTRTASSLRRRATAVALPLFFVALVVALQIGQGAFPGEFDNDDASHLVSSLLLHDWLLSGALRTPLAYALDYHAHYPLVGIGHWGPAWYAIEALWMLVAGTSKLSVLLSSGLPAAALATLIAITVAERSNWLLALAAGALFAAAGSVAVSSASLMLDVPVALLCFAAARAYAAYLRRTDWRWSFLFALFATAALLIKGNALALAPFVGFTLLLGRRLDLLARPSFWIPVPVIGLIAGPWYYKSYGLVAVGFRHDDLLAYTLEAVPANLLLLAQDLGPVVLPLAVLGALLLRADDRVGVCSLALVLAVFLFQAVVPAALQARYMIPALPGLLVLAADGAVFAMARLQRARVAIVAGVALVAAIYAAISYRLEPKRPYWAMAEASATVVTHLTDANPVVLVAGDNDEESAGIGELALRDRHRPRYFAVRGSRLLGGGGYNRGDYRPRFDDLDQVRATLDEYRVPTVLLSVATSGGQEWAHVTQLAQVLADDPRWRCVMRAATRNGRETSVWIRSDLLQASADPAQITALSGARLAK